MTSIASFRICRFVHRISIRGGVFTRAFSIAPIEIYMPLLLLSSSSDDDWGRSLSETRSFQYVDFGVEKSQTSFAQRKGRIESNL